eukprot:14808908-Ditylum_brightwellii.AAC.1
MGNEGDEDAKEDTSKETADMFMTSFKVVVNSASDSDEVEIVEHSIPNDAMQIVEHSIPNDAMQIVEPSIQSDVKQDNKYQSLGIYGDNQFLLKSEKETPIEAYSKAILLSKRIMDWEVMIQG